MQAKTKTFWLIIIVFLVGAVGGGFVGSSYFGKSNSNKRPNRSEIRKRFADRLQLTPEQSTIVDSLVEIHRSKINDISNQYSERFNMQRDTLRLEIRKLLNEEQNARYDDFIKELQQKEQKEENKRQDSK